MVGYARSRAAGALGPLEDASANGAATSLQTHATAAEKIGNCSHGFAAVSRMSTDREDQIAECQVSIGLLHGSDSLVDYPTLARIVRPLFVRRTFPLSRRSVRAAAVSLLLRLTLLRATTRSPKVNPGRGADLMGFLMVWFGLGFGLQLVLSTARATLCG
jgi:hypothetical protein